MMNDASGRRGFIRTVTIGGAGLALASKLPGLRQRKEEVGAGVYEVVGVRACGGERDRWEAEHRGEGGAFAGGEVQFRCDGDERWAGFRFEGVSRTTRRCFSLRRAI